MRRLFIAIVAASLALLSSFAWAEPTVAELAKQLKTSDDYRVRTQAALALGASKDEAAVKPLCDALASDANVSVKVAAAAALGKLGKTSALPCLNAAQGKETNQGVKTQIEKSIESLQKSSPAAGAAAPPPPGADTKFYIAIQVTNKTSRPTDEVDAIVRAAMQSKLLAKKGYAVAPKNETAAQGGQIVKSKKLKGFFLIATVEAPVYQGGNLSQSVRVSMWTYPDKALQGEFVPKLTQSGTPSKDVQSESELMKLCAESAVESFQKVTASM